MGKVAPEEVIPRVGGVGEVPIAPDFVIGGDSTRSYAFLDVLAKNVSRSWTTFTLPHFGHFLFPPSYSLKERISWKRWLHFLHLYEYVGMESPLFPRVRVGREVSIFIRIII